MYNVIIFQKPAHRTDLAKTGLVRQSYNYDE